MQFFVQSKCRENLNQNAKVYNMKIFFNIDYRTNWGESVYIVGSIPALGENDESKAVKMEFDSRSAWGLNLELAKAAGDFEYRYIVRNDNGYTKREWGKPHKFQHGRGVSAYEIFDMWQDQPAEKPFYSSAFGDCIFRRTAPSKPLPVKNAVVRLQVNAPTVRPDQVLAICGSSAQTGCWDPAKAIIMNDSDFPQWSVNLDIKDIEIPFQYKFVILNAATHEVVEWEEGDNRNFGITPERKQESLVVNDLSFRDRQRPWRGAGVAIPVFSIRSKDDFGVGDFMDIKLMVDWAAETGQQFLQLLPINDTTMTGTWTDSYPYNANSTFALHPMYLRLQAMGTLKDPVRMKHFSNLGHELNELSCVDYERVNNAKAEYTRELFKQDGKSTLESDDFKTFLDRNREWLTPYAAFCVLRDRNGSPEFSCWGDYAEYSPEKLEKFVAENPDDINYIYYIQYHLDKQMKEARRYAQSKGVAIKGDIPIGISRTSVDAWLYPRLFNMDCQAGAPPDDFSVLGQNWGFPTYNWEEMSHDGFAWWKARLRKMSEYFDAFRIDHILGFFRIWQIPMNALHGLLGVFNPALPFSPEELKQNYDFWIDPDLHTTPYIMDYFLGDFFGEYTDEARERFLVPLGYGRYRLKPEFATQRMVSEYFDSLDKDDKNTKLCNALLGLIDEVLFIEDPYEKGKYHPRISAQYTYIYRSLSDYGKWGFNRLYNDFYYHRHNDFWYGKAMWKLPPLIDATDMLVCAEDLGMIPACVPAVIDALDILSLEIQRMPKDPNAEFGNTWTYPYYSVCATSTHDMGGIRQWWEENREKTQHFYNNVLHENGPAPQYAEPWICDKIVTLHLKSPAMLTILPLQDWLSIDGAIRREDPREEQINVPANPRHYWRYRMHMTVEELMANESFCSYLHDKINDCGR